MTTDKKLLGILKKVGAIITDSHIVGTSGKHMSLYINKDALYPHTKEASQVGKMFAAEYKNKHIDVVVAPALGGIVLSQWSAHFLSRLSKREVLGVYTEKDEEKNQIFKRGYDKLVKGKKVLVIEDIANTGGSVKKVIASVKEAGGIIVATCVMVNRDPVNNTSKSMGSSFSSLCTLKAEAWEEKDCPLCKKNVPINTTVGHGKEYLTNLAARRKKQQKTS